jgi:hypothetical protein
MKLARTRRVCWRDISSKQTPKRHTDFPCAFSAFDGGEQSGFIEMQGVVAYQNGLCYNAVRQLEFV